MKIWVSPASNSTAQFHLKSTVEESIDLDTLDLGETDLNLRLTKYFKAWGFEQKHKSKWDNLNDGDTICFYSNRKIVYKAEVIKKINSRLLSDKIWIASNDEHNWPLIVILSNVQRVDLPMEQVNEVLGYSPKFIFQGNQLLIGDKAKALGELLDEIFEETVLSTNVDQMPKNYVVANVVKNGSTPQQQQRNFSIDQMIVTKRIQDFEKAVKTKSIVGEASEKLVVEYLKKEYPKANVRWMRETNNTLPFDILLEENSFRTVIEVKGTQSESIKTDFYLSSAEFDFALYCFENDISYKLFRVINVARTPKIIELDAKDLLNGEYIEPDTYRVKMSHYDLQY